MSDASKFAISCVAEMSDQRMLPQDIARVVSVFLAANSGVNETTRRQLQLASDLPDTFMKGLQAFGVGSEVRSSVSASLASAL